MHKCRIFYICFVEYPASLLRQTFDRKHQESSHMKEIHMRTSLAIPKR